MDCFDYIVIGAGSAGCVLAARLSESGQHSVLLLEAGPRSRSFWLIAPAGLGMLFHHPHLNWRFETEPVPSLGGRQVYWPRGKTLGGSSSINGMVYMRGHPEDFEHWAARGCEGWGWQDVLPWFLKSEDNVRGASHMHGTGGPIHVSDPVIRHPATDAFLQAAEAAGISPIEDLNAPPYEGVAYQQFNIRDGRRESSYTAYLRGAMQRRNLSVRTEALVRRVVLSDGRASGVEVSFGGTTQSIAANKEVIVCAGAIGTPHILNLSGIGDGEHLRRAGIETRHHLPAVGQNLQDHWNAPFVLRVTEDSSYNRALRTWRKYVQGMIYLASRRGYLAMGTSAVSAYVRSGPAQVQPDLQLAIRPMTATFQPSGGVLIDPQPGISGAAVLVGPESRGEIRLRSPLPEDAPMIMPNYLSDQRDIERLLVGIRLMRKVLEQQPMASRILAEQQPGLDLQSDDELTAYMKQQGGTSWHPAGTCRMAPRGAADGVVDPKLRVNGIAGLRIADASIMPRITSGNTHAPTVMIAENAAAMILSNR